MIKRLVVFGCSYSNGEEILYSELGEELDNLHKTTAYDPRIFFKKIESNSNTVKRFKEIQKQQYNLAWPKKLANKLGLECLNFSESGNSMEKMLWQFVDQYYKGNILDTDLVLFSQTKTERGLFFREFPMSFQVATANGPGLNRLLGISKTGGVSSVIDDKADRAMMLWFNDDRLTWDFLSVLGVLSHWKTKVNLQVIPTMKLNSATLQEYNRELFKKIEEEYSTLYLTNKGLDDFSLGADDYLPWGHPKETVHSRYADYLGEILSGRI